jgi:hypothetical protein
MLHVMVLFVALAGFTVAVRVRGVPAVICAVFTPVIDVTGTKAGPSGRVTVAPGAM